VLLRRLVARGALELDVVGHRLRPGDLPWHAEHSFGVVGGFGSCGLWQLAQAFSGLWATGLICGKPLGRDGL